ncbi:vegetative cell wall protein gp1 [Aplysia californica]|uniref:Vegetative cell wall protein gp1 n=1 Tax=Aplysia californica TaxID=6500 RepID=A0ABM1ADX5_APLCA|nr:vegetative cell wall protein gp1 [Aplysia californica]
MWDVLKEYPAARVKLEAIAVKRLEKYKKAPLEKVSMARSRSTPGLVESTGKTPLDSMIVHRHHTLPVGLIHKDGSGTGGVGGTSGGVVPVGGPREDDHSLKALINTQSEDNLISRCAGEPRRFSSDSTHHAGNMTTSMTISSMTSYCGTPPQRSPNVGEGGPAAVIGPAMVIGKNPFSSPPSPKILVRSDTSVVSSAPLVNGHPSLSHLTPHHGAPPPQPVSPAAAAAAAAHAQYAYQNLTFINPAAHHPHHPHHHQPINFLSPFCTPPPPGANYPASPSNFPASPAGFQGSSPGPGLIIPQAPSTPSSHTGMLPSPLATQATPPLVSYPSHPHSPALLRHASTHLGTASPSTTTAQLSQLLPSSYVHQPPAPAPAPAPLSSSSSLQHSPLPQRDEGQSEMLLKEITRLRERLAQLEGENSALTVKLNQQQWDVESRLTELEMHICQSDSVASTEFDGDSLRQDSKSTPPAVNRESII